MHMCVLVCMLPGVSKKNESRAADAGQRDSLIMLVGGERRPATPADPMCHSETSPSAGRVDENRSPCVKFEGKHTRLELL